MKEIKLDVELDEDVLRYVTVDAEKKVLTLTQISIVAPKTIEKFKDAGWTVEEAILRDRFGNAVIPDIGGRLENVCETRSEKIVDLGRERN